MPSSRTKNQGLLYEQAGSFAKDLETSQVAAVDQMLAAWTDSYWGVRGEMDAFLAKVAAAKAAGEPVSPAWAYQQQRLKNLLDTTKTQIARYAADASLVTEKAQKAAIAAALKHAEGLTKTAIQQGLPGLDATFGTVNPKVLEAGVGFLADGSVLRNHLALTLPAQAAEAVQDALLHGLATGKGQDWMIRKATEALGISHTRATTILRTESLRAYRHASRATYLANQDVLGGWTWHAALDARTCVACALMDGTEHPLDATLDGHPRCRCAMVPRTKTWEELGAGPLPDTRPPVRSGKEWLEGQPPSVQRAIMGRAKFNAWTEGLIGLDDMVARTFSPQWGTMRTERSLKAILEGRNANWQDVSSLPPVQVLKPPPVADPKTVRLYADRYDLDYLQEWLETPGNSPNVLVNVQAAINLKVARLGRQGPTLPRPDTGKVKAALEKLANAVATKGYPSKGYSQTKAIYKAQANGTPGTQVGVVKSLTWDQKITAQAILDEHDAALPALARQAEKAKALEKAHDEALEMHAQVLADEAYDKIMNTMAVKVAQAESHDAVNLAYDLQAMDLDDALKAAGDDLVKVAQVKAQQTALAASREAYQQTQQTVQANWAGTNWTKGNALLDVDDTGWGAMTQPGLPQPVKVGPKSVWAMLKDPDSSGWSQHLVPDPAQVASWKNIWTHGDGHIVPAQYDKAKAALADLSPQDATNLQEALDQDWAAGTWKPEPEYVEKIKEMLGTGTMTVDDVKALAATADKPLSKANVTQALAEWQAEQIAKAAIPVPKPVIDPTKVKWEKVSDAQVAKLVQQAQDGKVSLDDLYVKFQASKNAGPKANYAKAILTLEGKDVPSLPTPAMPNVPAAQGPLWPTKPPWEPDDLRFTGTTLGTHGARVMEAPDGTRWLFKPPKDPKDAFLATLDEGASRLQSMVGLKAPDTYVVTIGGKRGSIQRMFPATDGFPQGFQPTSLSGPDLALVQREHALDWLLANHDGHLAQFLRLEDGSMVGIDKGQAFRWFGQDRLDWDFHPNQAYGAPEPVYNALWRAFAQGKDVDLDPPGSGPLWDQIKALQAIPEDTLRELFRPYAEQAAARGLLAKRQQFPGLKSSSALENDVDAFLDALVARQRNLDKDFTALYEKAAKARAKALPGWTPKAAAPKVTGGKAKWVGAEKPAAPKPPTEPQAETAALFTGWVQAAKDRLKAFNGKDLEASNNWARFQRVVNDLDETAAKELLDRSYLRPEDYQEALDLIAQAKAQRATLEAAYKRAMADHDKAIQAYKKDLNDWKDANGIKDLTAGMDGDVKRHASDQAGVTWAKKHFNEKRYTPGQRQALQSYTGSSYRSWNDHLRTTEGKPTQYLETYKRIDSAMEAQPIPEDVILHRGTEALAFKIDGETLHSGSDLSRLIGSVQVEHGYMSTSVGNSAAFSDQGVQLKIRTPAGTPGSYVQMFSNFSTERELILARGTRMYVHNAYKRNGRWFLEVEVVPGDFDPVNATPSPSAKPWKK